MACQGHHAQTFAHSRNKSGLRQPLLDHLRNVSKRCEGLAEWFGLPSCGRLLGLWHDIGKLQRGFQEYLIAGEQAESAGKKLKRKGPPHSPAGAARAFQHIEPIAMVIAAHHEGLRCRADLANRLRTDYSQRAEVKEVLEGCVAYEPSDLAAIVEEAKTELAAIAGDVSSAEFAVRFLLSALVDADRLDTEAHYEPERRELRAAGPSLQDMEEKLHEELGRLKKEKKTTVNRVRNQVLDACLQAAKHEPGIFRLTAPTGAGKTLSSLAFALRHGVHHGLRRIVAAIPYTSIIDQTAQVYRKILGPESVLEHHSAVREWDRAALDMSGEEWEDLKTKLHLATENWDVPLIVTTTNQLFESIFSNHPSRLRKIHNLARSVIIIDEVQTLPVELLQPTLEAIRFLCTRCGTTVVLCTATQPAVEGCKHLHGLDGIRDILPDAPKHFRALSRVSYEWPTRKLAWSEIAEMMRSEEQVLAVVNTRSDALRLFDALADENALHLSASMCGAHRREVLAEIDRRLKKSEPCRVVSTQVVEAGVDLDFPVVMRAVGPLDRIVQVAGRCNREGKLAKGKVIIFDPEEGHEPQGTYRSGTDQARTLIAEGELDPDDPAMFERYFGLLYGIVECDAHGIEELRKHFKYPEVAKQYRFIEKDTEAVVIAEWHREKVESILHSIRMRMTQGLSPSREDFRKLQPYMVNMYRRQYEERADYIDDSILGLPVWRGPYDEVRGLVTEYTRLEDNLW